MQQGILGTVVTFDTKLRFGFIRPNGQIRQVQVTGEALEQAGYSTLKAGEQVVFTVTYDDRYIPTATDINRLDGVD